MYTLMHVHIKTKLACGGKIHGKKKVLTESPTHHNQHKTKCPKAAQAHGHQQSSANATATGLLSECHGVDVKAGVKEKHLKSMSLKGLQIELCGHRALKSP